MFDHVLQALPPQVVIVMHGSDVIRQPPSDKYDVLKAALISRFSNSESKHFEQVIHHLELGDSKLSHLLHQIQQILGCEYADNPRFIHHLFLSLNYRTKRVVCSQLIPIWNRHNLLQRPMRLWKPTWLCRLVDSLQL